MSFCSSCGTEIKGEGKFCANCGKPITSNVAVESTKTVNATYTETRDEKKDENKKLMGTIFKKVDEGIKLLIALFSILLFLAPLLKVSKKHPYFREYNHETGEETKKLINFFRAYENEGGYKFALVLCMIFAIIMFILILGSATKGLRESRDAYVACTVISIIVLIVANIITHNGELRELVYKENLWSEAYDKSLRGAGFVLFDVTKVWLLILSIGGAVLSVLADTLKLEEEVEPALTYLSGNTSSNHPLLNGNSNTSNNSSWRCSNCGTMNTGKACSVCYQSRS